MKREDRRQKTKEGRGKRAGCLFYVRTIFVFIVAAFAASASRDSRATGAGWQILFATNASGPYVSVTNVSSATGFVKLQGPSGQSIAVSQVLTISNTTSIATMSNGTIVVTAPAATTNDYNAIGGMAAPTNPVILNIQRPQ